MPKTPLIDLTAHLRHRTPRTPRTPRFGGWLAALLCLLGGAAALPADIVHLKNGAVIKAEIVSRKPDKIFLDLGFTLLTVPADQVDRIEKVEAKAEAGKAIVEDLFTSQPDRTEITVEENVNRCGPSVALVRTPVGLGSGFVIHESGYVITNDHVIAGEHKISLTFFTRGEKELKKETFSNVRIVATNPQMDLALLKIDGVGDRKFPVVPLAIEKQTHQGQRTFAIGNPLGLERSVSQGIIAVPNRAMDGQVYIQTTTQINPGNSGGPLFNMKGEVVGVTNMKIVTTGAEGLGFAIPTSVLKQFIQNRDAFAFDPLNPNNGYKYNKPPTAREEKAPAPAANPGTPGNPGNPTNSANPANPAKEGK